MLTARFAEKEPMQLLVPTLSVKTKDSQRNLRNQLTSFYVQTVHVLNHQPPPKSSTTPKIKWWDLFQKETLFGPTNLKPMKIRYLGPCVQREDGLVRFQPHPSPHSNTCPEHKNQFSLLGVFAPTRNQTVVMLFSPTQECISVIHTSQNDPNLKHQIIPSSESLGLPDLRLSVKAFSFSSLEGPQDDPLSYKNLKLIPSVFERTNQIKVSQKDFQKLIPTSPLFKCHNIWETKELSFCDSCVRLQPPKCTCIEWTKNKSQNLDSDI